MRRIYRVAARRSSSRPPWPRMPCASTLRTLCAAYTRSSPSGIVSACPSALVIALRFVSTDEMPPIPKAGGGKPLKAPPDPPCVKKIEAALRAEVDRLHSTLVGIDIPSSLRSGLAPDHSSQLEYDLILDHAVLRAALDKLSGAVRRTWSADDACVLQGIERNTEAGHVVDAADAILTAAAPRSLARTLDDAQPWNRRVSQLLEWQSHKTASLTSRMLYLAAFRLPSVEVLEDERSEIGSRIHSWTDGDWHAAAECVLEIDGRGRLTPLQCASRALFYLELKISISDGLWELFSDTDLAVVLLGSECVANIAPGTVLPEGVQTQALTLASSAPTNPEVKKLIRQRLFTVGLHRYGQWMRNQSLGAAPQADSGPTAYEEILKVDQTPPADFKNTASVLAAWEAVTKKACLEDIVMTKRPFLDQKVLMFERMYTNLQSRMLPVDTHLVSLLTVTAVALPNRSSVAQLQTLVVTGESGSGKTLSMLALAKQPNVLCVYMTASELLQDVRDLVAEQDNRNARCAELLHCALTRMDAALKEPLLPSRNHRIVMIIVDEAGMCRNLVRAMCSPHLQLEVEVKKGQRVPLATYLGVESVQLVVGGTGVSVMKEKCGSSPDSFSHTSMKSVEIDSLTEYLDKKISSNGMRWISSVLSRSAAREVKELFDEAKKNPRMHACMVSVLCNKSMPLQSPVVKQELSVLMSTLAHQFMRAEETAICRLSAIASIVAELHLCLASARMMFRQLNALSNLTLYGALNHILYGLAFSCLRWDSMCSPCASDVAVYGVIVDNVTHVEYPCPAGKAPDEVTQCYPGEENAKQRCIKTMLYASARGDVKRVVQYTLCKDHLHRYSVSAIHLRLALSIVGIERTVWTRLGFERIVMDMCYLHTLMALNAKESELSTPAWSDVEPAEAVTAGKAKDMGRRECNRRRKAATVIGNVWRTTTAPGEREKNILGKFDVEVDGTNVSVQKRADGANLFNDASLDPLRLLKAKLWALARQQKAADNSGRVLVVRAQLPLPAYVLEGTSEDLAWPTVSVKEGKTVKQKRVIPTPWLLRALGDAVVKDVTEYFNDGGPQNNEVPVIVLGMLYEGAPGLDGVIAYGKCRRRNASSPTTLTVERLVKLQTKCLQDGGERESDDENLINTCQVDDFLKRMGNGLSLKQHELSDEHSKSLKVDHHVVVYGESRRCVSDDTIDDPLAALFLNKDTAPEAVHPMPWRVDLLQRNISSHTVGFVHDVYLSSVKASPYI